MKKFNLSLVFQLAKRDFLERFTGSILGVFWAFILPAVNIAIYTLIFSKVMSVKLPNLDITYGYGLYLAAGLLPWITFSNTIIRISGIFLEKKHIISKVSINLLYFPLSVVLSESISFIISMGIFISVLIFLGVPFDKLALLLPFIYFFQQLLAFSLGLIFGVLNVFIRDIKEIVNIIMQLWFWLTPIVYTVNILPKTLKKYIIYNPSYSFIHFYQNVFVLKENVNFKIIFIYSFVTITLFIFSYIIFKKLEKEIRDFL